jgi:N-acetylglucosaminyl-diphospho-decaprenol L-rhamnosyltransferase
MSSSLDIIIVNWNAGQQLRQCLDSIVSIKDDGFKIIRVVVVDNASTDGSVEGLDDQKLPLTIIRNKENYGFAKGCNMGAWGSKADYLLFLNPDIRLYQNSLGKALVFMEQTKSLHIGIVGIQLVGENGGISRSCARFPSLYRFLSKMLGLDRLFPFFFAGHFMTKSDHSTSREVDQVMAAFFLVRRPLFEIMRGFDEQFFVYFEDVDFSLRAKQAGWKTFYLTDVRAYHRGQGISEQVKAKRLFYSLKSRILYGYKHFNWWSATALMLATLVLEPLTRLVLGALRSAPKEMRETIDGYFLLWTSLPRLLKPAYWRNST